jgi:basic membrane lipoprotein Med (substrate-binding protein (PBP1-ABC) superfamily)
MPINSRLVPRAGALALIVALGLALTACVGEPEVALPAPGRTIEATASTVQDLGEYRIAVVVGDESPESQTLLAATREFAASSGAELVEFAAAETGEDPVGDAFEEAAGAGADVVVGLGAGVTEVFDFESGKLLDQQFLIVGGQLPEPTHNVTAVIWPGANSREPGDADSVTESRGLDALGAGVASIRDGLSGIVLSID